MIACGPGASSVGSHDGDLLTCAGPPFSPAVFDRTPNVEEADSPEARALASGFGSPEFPPGAGRGWRELGRTDDEVAFATGEPPVLDGFVVLRREGGNWAYRQWGSGCIVQPYRPGRNLARWGLNPTASPLTPAARSITVVVNDRACASGVGPDERLDDPTVEVTPEALIVTFTSRPPSGDQNCPGNPAVKRTVELPEPLGNRELLDGGLYPPQPPCRVEGDDCAND